MNGWQSSPAPGIPANVPGFAASGKKSWMTETSGEDPAWLYPPNGYPSDGGWGLALRIHQALTTGRQSAWIYWTFTESDNNGNVTSSALTNQAAGTTSPKYVAAKHFFKYIRPGAYRVGATTTGASPLLASAYLHEEAGTLTAVLVNPSATVQTAMLWVPDLSGGAPAYSLFTSSAGSYWQVSALSLSDGTASLSVPAYGIVTLYGPGAVPVAVGAASDRPTIQLFQNQPNPAGSSTRIGFSLPQPEYVQLHLYDAQGRLLKTLVEEIKAPGVHGITLPLTALAAGTYFYKIKAGSFEATRKMVVVK